MCSPCDFAFFKDVLNEMLTFALRRGLEEELCSGFPADAALIRRTSDVNVYVGDNFVACWSFWGTLFLFLGVPLRASRGSGV